MSKALTVDETIECYKNCPRREQFVNLARDAITIKEVDKFYRFLQGELPSELHMTRHPHMSPRQAYRVIYYLQEIMGILPDTYERCCTCGDLYDSMNEGDDRHCDLHRKD